MNIYGSYGHPHPECDHYYDCFLPILLERGFDGIFGPKPASGRKLNFQFTLSFTKFYINNIFFSNRFFWNGSFKFINRINYI